MAELEQSQQPKLILSANILDALGLVKQPFTSTILSGKEIYLDSTITQLIDSLKHHIQFSPLLLIVEGEYNSGKTTLFRYLSQSEISNIKLLPIQAEASDTLMQIQHKMSIHLEDLGAANYLDDNLKQLKTFDTIPVLIIDDAHTLSDTILQEILRYKTDLNREKEIDLKILLLANPGMAETIEKISNLEHNQLYVQSMPAYTEKQILNFCQHRLLAAGYSGQPILDSNNAQLILKKTNGLPGLILEAAGKIIEKNLKKKTSSGFSLKKLIMPAVISLIIFIGLISYILNSTQPKDIAAYEYAAPVAQPVQTEPEQTIIEESIETIESGNQQTELASAEAEKTPQPLAENIQQNINSISPDTPENPAPPTMPDSPAQPAAPAQAATTKTMIASSAVQEKIISSEAITAATETKPPESIQKAAVEKPTAIIEPLPAIKKKTVIVSKPPVHHALTELTNMGLHDHKWLLKQNANQWTLQILGAREPQTLLKFARQHKLGDDSAWYETELSDKPWYIIVHRFYTDKNIARTSIARLPTNLQTAKPWVKSMASIHQAIK